MKTLISKKTKIWRLKKCDDKLLAKITSVSFHMVKHSSKQAASVTYTLEKINFAAIFAAKVSIRTK